MIPILQILCNLPMLALHCCKILSDGEAPCSELMLHHTMQCTGASWEVLQVPSNFAANTTQLRDSKSKRPEYCTQILSHRGAFTQTCFTQTFAHTHAFTQGRFYTQGCFYAPNFYTQTRGYFYKQVHLHSDAFTEECFYTHMLLHRASFNTN